MKGFVPTPAEVVDLMVSRLFEVKPPSPDHLLLDPGCGTGEMIEGVLRWCERERMGPPRMIGVELHPGRAAEARSRFQGIPSVEIVEGDFLEGTWPAADYVLGNPPYVPITQLSEAEKARYRDRFATATGRFDLYLLFFEAGLRVLRAGGRMVFITPEKYLSVGSARALRKMLARHWVREVVLVAEDSFPGLITYPAVTVVDVRPARGATRVLLRNGSEQTVAFPESGASLAGLIHGRSDSVEDGPTLADVARRISCGVATGADRIFVQPTDHLAEELKRFAFPTMAGRQLDPETPPQPVDSMLVPYHRSGALMEPEALGALGDYLAQPDRRKALLARTCARRKPWYAFHETPPLDDLLRPKLLCKDIAQEPYFWMDEAGEIVPRHSVYYIVPHDPEDLRPLADFLNGEYAREWLKAHAQPAANGYRRLQSTVLRRLPIPDALAGPGLQPSLFDAPRTGARRTSSPQPA